MKEKEISERRPAKEPIRKRKSDPVIEVDLHINELIDTTAGMNNADILEYQMNKFNDVMKENIKNKNRRIVFIHGKGDGVLKTALLKELKKNYPSCYYQDASFQEYGYGATMVIIK
jgi:dsDNA-specific endonuclease/ATPase MutS2